MYACNQRDSSQVAQNENNQFLIEYLLPRCLIIKILFFRVKLYSMSFFFVFSLFFQLTQQDRWFGYIKIMWQPLLALVLLQSNIQENVLLSLQIWPSFLKRTPHKRHRAGYNFVKIWVTLENWSVSFIVLKNFFLVDAQPKYKVI